MSQFNSQNQHSWLQSLLLSALVTLLFWEWLKPLEELTDTTTIVPFVCTFAFVLLVKFFRLPLLLEFIIVGVGILYLFHFLFIEGPFFDLAWVAYITDELILSIQLILAKNVIGHSPLLRTLLFFSMIWLLATSVYYNLFGKRRILLFFLCTIIYLTLLDTFSPIKMDVAILRTVVIGFCLLAALEMTTISHQFRNISKGETRGSLPFRWILASLVIIVGVTSLGYFAPKGQPKWPDPVHFIKSYSEQAGAGPRLIQRIGYGDNDEILGGAFIQDDTVVFTAIAEEKEYWRGESKDFYTGRGWVRSETTTETLPYSMMQEMFENQQVLQLYEESIVEKRVRSYIQMQSRQLSTIFYPGELRTFSAFPNNGLVQVDYMSGSVSLWQGENQPSVISEYTVESDFPKFSIKELRGVTQQEMESIPPVIKEKYTQLPEALPNRVQELALELTKDQENPYDKVKEIEQFFKQNEFTYDTKDVPIPEEGQDYVDQFLFETKRGYCNNFSTSMVVMLRSIDIPARWVKGFTFGEIESNLSEEIKTVVRNKNAHSWVEVYFPGRGWVPFEPTKSFSNSFQFAYDDDQSSQTDLEGLAERSQQKNEPNLQSEDDVPEKGHSTQQISWYKKDSFYIVLTSIMILFATFLLFFRRKLFLSWIILRYRDKRDLKMFLRAYEWMILYLGRFVLPKEPSQTMREYVTQLESKIETHELQPLTRIFEEYRYGNRPRDDKKMNVAYEIWESIMRKLRS